MVVVRGKSQYEVARLLTFNFDERLVELAKAEISNKELTDFITLLMNNQELLSNKEKEWDSFFDKVKETADYLTIDTSVLEELKPGIKSGTHALLTENLLSNKKEWVSRNEQTYVIRTHGGYMEPVNKEFKADLNSDFTQNVMVIDKRIGVEWIADKHDVISISTTHIKLKDMELRYIVV